MIERVFNLLLYFSPSVLFHLYFQSFQRLLLTIGSASSNQNQVEVRPRCSCGSSIHLAHAGFNLSTASGENVAQLIGNSLNISISDTQVLINIRSNSQLTMTVSKNIGDSEANLFDISAAPLRVLMIKIIMTFGDLCSHGKSESERQSVY